MATAFRLVTTGPISLQHNFISPRHISSLCRVATRSGFQEISYRSNRTESTARFVTHNTQPKQSRAQLSQIARSVSTRQLRNFSQIRNLRDENKSSNQNLGSSDKKPVPDTPLSRTPKAVPQILKAITPPVLHENIYTLPNFLTTTRIITAPIICYALVTSQPVLAFGLFAYSSITDLVDGYLARRYNSGTVLGSILDPFADKLLMTLTTATLYTIGTFPWWLALTILGRDGGLLLSALYFRWISLPPPRTMKRYWDFSLPSAEVRPTEISKINTMLQFLLVANGVLLPALPEAFVDAWNLWGIFEGWMGLVAGTTIWSGLSYIFTKDAIRYIKHDEVKSSEEKK